MKPKLHMLILTHDSTSRTKSETKSRRTNGANCAPVAQILELHINVLKKVNCLCYLSLNTSFNSCQKY